MVFKAEEETNRQAKSAPPKRKDDVSDTPASPQVDNYTHRIETESPTNGETLINNLCNECLTVATRILSLSVCVKERERNTSKYHLYTFDVRNTV